MSNGIAHSDLLAERDRAASDRDWAAHRGALQTPELRSALEKLHSCLEQFLKDAGRR